MYIINLITFFFCETDHFINFDIEECNTNKLFCNKIWQATKFTKKHVDNVGEIEKIMKNTHEVKLSKMDRWILSRLSYMVQNVNEGLEKCEIHVATFALKNFLYYDFCDVYLVSPVRFSFFFFLYLPTNHFVHF